MLDQSVLKAEVYLAVLAEEGSFSKAAKRLSTAQSFVTKIIGEVERDMLKVKIFERSTRRVELTEVGRVIVPEIQLALRQAEMAWDLAGYYSLLTPHPLEKTNGFNDFPSNRARRNRQLWARLLPNLYQVLTLLSD